MFFSKLFKRGGGWKKICGSFVIFILIFFVIAHVVGLLKINRDMIFGTSFNYEYAQSLGLDPRQVFKTIVEDWNFKYIRLSAQWNLIEKQPQEYDFVELDWMMKEAMEHQAKIILSVGQKTPRWPECHDPEWATTLTQAEYERALSRFIETTVKRYRQSPALEIWQVENEPFLNFGTCRSFTKKKLDEEVALVKHLDANHPTLTSDSGELSLWTKTARAADLFGTTMYRVVWNKYVKYWNYDWVPASFYKLKLFLNGRSLEAAYIMELQAEPWIPGGTLLNTPLKEQYKSMDLKRLKKNVDFSRQVGMPRAYLWGAEWWYWLEQQGSKDIVEYIKTLPKE